MTDISSADLPSAQSTEVTPGARSGVPALYRAIWRWHFYAGLFTVPFLIALAISGMMILWIGFLDGRDGEYSLSVPAETETVAVSPMPPGSSVLFTMCASTGMLSSISSWP